MKQQPVFGETWICDACKGRGWRTTKVKTLIKEGNKQIKCGWCDGTGLRQRKEPNG